MHNVILKHFLHVFIRTKENEKKYIKTVVKIHEESLVYLCGDKTANHVNFMLPMLISCSCYF